VTSVLKNRKEKCSRMAARPVSSGKHGMYLD
jgi:hypothetical protein